MRKFLFAVAAAGSALAVAAPASAQYYSGPRHEYGAYGYGYGNNGWSDVGGLEQRIYNVLRSLDGVRYDQRYQLRAEAIRLDRELRYAARNGLNPYEARAFDVRIDELERWQSTAAYRGYGHERYYGDRGHYGDHGAYGHYRNDRDDRDDDD